VYKAPSTDGRPRGRRTVVLTRQPSQGWHVLFSFQRTSRRLTGPQREQYLSRHTALGWVTTLPVLSVEDSSKFSEARKGAPQGFRQFSDELAYIALTHCCYSHLGHSTASGSGRVPAPPGAAGRVGRRGASPQARGRGDGPG
jgi:hypothetical protein